MRGAEPARDPLVVFTPSGRRGRFARGTPLLAAARQLGVDLDSVCGGRGLCGRCEVRVVEGVFPKYAIRSQADHASPPSPPEERVPGRGGLENGHRLSCHARVEGDLVIDVPPGSQVHRQVVRKPYQSCDISVSPVVHLHTVEPEAARPEAPRGDLERLLDALAREWQLEGLTCDPQLLTRLQAALRAGERAVTVAVRAGREIVGVWPGFRDRALGVAVDVGSTTLAAHLCELASGAVLASAGAMNPQIRFGEDLMSRVSYAALHDGGAEEMTRAVREAVDALVARLALDAGASPDDVVELCLVGNPIMHHLLLGISPAPLGQAPFPLATDRSVTLPARDLELAVHPGARAYVLPCIAGHVGADTAAVLLAEAPWEHEGTTLLVDVGTNAELVLSARGRLLAASSPTGPAFEGAQISCGQRAAPGAVERVRIDPDTLEPRFQVIGCELWSDDPGFAAQLGSVGIRGVCGTGIVEAVAELFLAGLIDRNGRMDGALAARSPRVVPDGRTHAYVLHRGDPELRITQGDVRAIQLAKAALYAGARLLMNRLGVARVDRIRLAGAFGSQIDPGYAMLLGMIPDCHLGSVSCAGNAAGTGAVMALLDADARAEIEARVRSVEKIELALETGFQDCFVRAMALPHASDPFPELSKRVALARSRERTAGPVRHRRRGRKARD